MKIAVIGANGQLGNDVVAAFTKNGDEVVPLTHAEIELSNIDSVSTCLQGLASANCREHGGDAPRGELRTGTGEGVRRKRTGNAKSGAGLA